MKSGARGESVGRDLRRAINQQNQLAVGRRTCFILDRPLALDLACHLNLAFGDDEELGLQRLEVGDFDVPGVQLDALTEFVLVILLDVAQRSRGDEAGAGVLSGL